MRAGGIVILLMLIAAMSAGCQAPIVWGTAAFGGAYVATGEAQTEGLTYMSQSAGGNDVQEAVDYWLARGELPIPVLPDGVHSFSTKKGELVRAQNSTGAQVVELYDGGRLIAEYVVSWNKQPVEYRLDRAVNRLYDGKLDVANVPIIKTRKMGA
jgi:hypothetical protein